MAGYPPPYPPPGPPPGYDPRAQRRFLRDQARAQRDAFRAQRAQARYQMRGMRRGSILGPLLLIGLGIVFLLVQTGRLDEAHVWNWYGHWWPFLLVAAGVIVLIEWGVDQFLMRDPARPPYRRSLGGGIFTIIFLFIIAGYIAHAVHDYPNGYSRLFPGYHFDDDSFDQFFGDKHESDQNLDLAFNPGSSLSVVNPRGDVTISGTSDDNRIHLAIHKQVYARSDSDADSKARQLVPSTANSGSAFSLVMPTLDGARADLVITVPSSSAATVTTNHGDVHIASIRNAVSVTDNHGDIELSAITGPVSAHINSGSSSITARGVDGSIAIQGHAQDITLTDIAGPVTINGEFFGATHLQHIAGNIHFHTSRTDLQLARLDGETDISSSNITSDQVLGPVVLTSSNRNILLDRVAGDISITNRNGTIDLTAAPTLGNLTVQDRNGAINLTLPEHSSFAIDAHTTNGELNSDFQLSATGSENSKSLTGSIGSGGPDVHLETTNSDISIHKADVQPIAATPPVPPRITLARPTSPTPPVKPKSRAKPKSPPPAPPSAPTP